MSTDAEWFTSFDAVGEKGVFGKGRTQRDLGVFGAGGSTKPTIPSDSPLTGRFGRNPKYLRVDLFSQTINNIFYEFPEWHEELKKLLPEEQLDVKYFKWVTGGAIVSGELPRTDDEFGEERHFPKTTLLWLIHKFMRSEGIRNVLKSIEFSGPFSPAILGELGDGDQSEITEFIRHAHGLSHLKIGHRLVPPDFKDDHCAPNTPGERFEYHWHVPIISAITDKLLLKQLELILGHFDAENLGKLLLAPMSVGGLEKVSLTFRPMHDDVQLGQLLHTLAANALSSLTHLELRLSSCRYNRYGRLPRFLGPENGPNPEQDLLDLGLPNDTYITAYLFDRVGSLKMFNLSFGEHIIGHPLLNHHFGPDMRRFLFRQQSREQDVRVEFEGIQVIGCMFRSFLIYLLGKLPSLDVCIAAKQISVKFGSAKVSFNITRSRECSTGSWMHNNCGACRSLYPVVVVSVSLLLNEYSADKYRKVESIPTEYSVQDCVLENFTRDVNTCASRQPWVWWCYPELHVQDRRATAWFLYKRTGRIVDVAFKIERCELQNCCRKCWPGDA